MNKPATPRKIRENLSPEQRKEAERIGSIMDQFKSAGAQRQR